MSAPSAAPPADSPYIIRVRNAVERLRHVKSGLRAIGKVLHPNHITALRLPATLATMGIDPLSQVASTTAWAVTTLLDWLDGAVARSTPGMETAEGMILDSTIDKICNAMALLYQVCLHCTDPLLAATAAGSVGCNVASSVQRGRGQLPAMEKGLLHPGECEPVSPDANIGKIKANVWGKAKQTVECVSIGALFAAGDSPTARVIASTGLAVSSVLSIMSTWKRSRAAQGKAA